MEVIFAAGGETWPMHPRKPHRGRVLIGAIFYILGFSLLILAVWHIYLVPAMDAARHADASGKRDLQAVAWLMMTLVLVYMLAGLILAFRPGRFFFPPPDRKGKPKQTEYIDAWKEAGKRMDGSEEQDRR